MYSREIEGHSLWAWAAAAVSAPAAQFLGSVPWYWTLAAGAMAGAVWLWTESVTARGVRALRPVAVLQLLFLIFAVSAAAGWSGACWLEARRAWTVPAVLLVLAACIAQEGCRAGARCGAVLFWFLAGMFLLLAVFAIPDGEARWLLPERRAPGGEAAAVLLLPAAAALLPRRKGKSPWGWALGLGLAAVGISVLTAAVLSPGVAVKTEGAFFEMVRGISILGVAERFEAVVAAAMTIGWFCLLSLLLTGAGHVAETLHPGWGRWAVWGVALIAGLLMPWTKAVPAWAAALGALLFWCIIPMLGTKRETRGISKNFREI